MAMGAVAVASTVVPSPGGAPGTQYSDVQAGGPPDQSSKPNVPAPEGGSQTPGGDGASEGGGSVPPDTSKPGGGQNQNPKPPQQSEPGGGNDSQQPNPGGGKGDGAGNSDGSGKGSGKGNGSGTGGGSGSGSGSEAGSSGGSSSRPVGKTARDEAEVLSLVNEEREDVGCKPLKASKQLSELAGDFSRDMAIEDFFSHLAPDGSSPWDRAEDLGILDLGGENIARGQESPESVVEDWMDSPSHRANILNCEYRTMGVGEYLDDDGPWWTQDFGY